MDRHGHVQINFHTTVIRSLMFGGGEEKVAYFQLVLTTCRLSVVNSVNPCVELCKARSPPSFVCSWLTKEEKKLETESLQYILTVSVS